MAKRGKPRIAKPKVLWQRILERPFVYDVLLAWVAVFGTTASAIRAFAARTCWDHVAGWLYIVGGTFVLVFAVVKFLVQWFKHEEDESVHELEGCLVVLHTELSEAMPDNLPRPARIRVTIHVPDGDNTLVQATNYIGGDGGGIGRTLPKKAGIIGLALKEGRCIAASRQNENYLDYVEDLQKNWEFTKAEAVKRDPAAMSWVAVTIGNPVDGILYADSTIQGFFDDPAVLQSFSVVAVAIAKFLDLRNR